MNLKLNLKYTSLLTVIIFLTGCGAGEGNVNHRENPINGSPETQQTPPSNKNSPGNHGENPINGSPETQQTPSSNKISPLNFNAESGLDKGDVIAKAVEEHFSKNKFNHLYSRIRDRLKESKFHYYLERITDYILETYMKVVTKQAFAEVNFGETGPGYLAKKGSYMDPEGGLNEEKLVISEMIKSGMFGELFSYLKDKEISTFFVKNWTPFPSAEFDALVAESPQHKLTKSISYSIHCHVQLVKA